ncbi:hypothetical protein Bca4012_025705 [Brassica carinata]|uniref:Uncharacterized protein n=1 Tax=Brassica carinata TaxID=52824 RepID=A0A8X8ATT3_BRACI|nr:hypothetical protein Bca52824_022815 [Brassica carinata]
MCLKSSVEGRQSVLRAHRAKADYSDQATGSSGSYKGLIFESALKHQDGQIRVDRKHAERDEGLSGHISVHKRGGAWWWVSSKSRNHFGEGGGTPENTCEEQESEGSVKHSRKFSTFFTEDPNLITK